MNEPTVIGRYAIFDAIGGGGMAQVYLGRLLAEEGFTRVVAVKRVHPAAANDAQITTMLLDEARLVARVRHPNVVPTIDVAKVGRELILVMEYIRGASLSWLMRAEGKRQQKVPLPIAVRASIETLTGLHAAHEARSERGRPLEMVHRDVSPHNILVGTDGVTRIADFGIAKAEGKLSVTREGEVKGKLAYMAPEQLQGQTVDRRTDVFAMGIVLWELCTGRRLFEAQGDSVSEAIRKILQAKVSPPTRFASDLPPAIEAITMRALSADPAGRFDTAEQMAHALEDAITPARTKDVASWVSEIARPLLETHAELIARIEDMSAIHRADEIATRRPSRGELAASSSTFASAPIESAVISSTIAAASPPRDQTLPLGVHAVPMRPPAPIRDSNGTLVSIDRSGSTRAVPRGTSLLPVLAIGAGAIAVLGLAAGGGIYMLRPHPKTSSPALAASSAAVPPPPSGAAPSAVVIASAVVAPTVVAPTDPPAEGGPSARPAPSLSAPPIKPAAPPKPKPREPDCEVPYSIDPSGLRVPRPECVR